MYKIEPSSVASLLKKSCYKRVYFFFFDHMAEGNRYPLFEAGACAYESTNGVPGWYRKGTPKRSARRVKAHLMARKVL